MVKSLVQPPELKVFCWGALTQPPGSAMDEAVAMVARSLWSVQVLKVPVRAPDVGGL